MKDEKTNFTSCLPFPEEVKEYLKARLIGVCVPVMDESMEIKEVYPYAKPEDVWGEYENKNENA